MGYFSRGQISGATVYERGSFINEAGHFKVEVDKVVFRDTEEKGPMIFVEFLIKESSIPDKQPVGSRRSYAIKLADKRVAFNNLLEFAVAVMGVDHRTQKAEYETIRADSDEIWNAAMGGDQIFKGKQVHLETVPTVAKKVGADGVKKTYTRCNWSPVNG